MRRRLPAAWRTTERMRFLHTADWHVGKTAARPVALRRVRGGAGRDRRDRARPERRRGALAGDVFDSPAPPAEAEKLVYDFLARLLPERHRLRRSSPATTTTRASWPRSPAARGPAHLRARRRAAARPGRRRARAEPRRRERGARGRAAVRARAADRRRLPARSAPSTSGTRSTRAAWSRCSRCLTAGFTPKTVNLVLGHLLISGARVGTGERPLHLGEIYGVNAQQLPSNAQYIALGHLHRPQELDGAVAHVLLRARSWSWTSARRSRRSACVIVDAQPGTRADDRVGPALRPAAACATCARHARRAGRARRRPRRRLPARGGARRRPGARAWPSRSASCCRTRSTCGCVYDARRRRRRRPSRRAARPSQLFADFYRRTQRRAAGARAAAAVPRHATTRRPSR